MFELNIRIYLQFGIWDLKTSFGPIGPKILSKSRTLAPIFINKTSFYPNSNGEFNELQKCQNNPSPSNLVPKFWVNWTQKSYQPVSLEPEFQFSKTSPHFMWNVQLNKMYYLNIRIYLQLGVWGLQTGFGLIEPNRITKP